jgi:hypothetical protein
MERKKRGRDVAITPIGWDYWCLRNSESHRIDGGVYNFATLLV